MDNIFVLLHKSDDNSPAVINITQVEQIYKSSNNNDTCIVMINNDDDMHVNESVEKVYNLFCKKIEGKTIVKTNEPKIEKTPQLLNENKKEDKK